MALFRRRRQLPDFIDLGGDYVAIPAERAEKLADAAITQILDSAAEPIWGPSVEAIDAALLRRHGSADMGAQLTEWLGQIAILGYRARSYEENLDSVETVVPSLAVRLKEWLDADETVKGALVEVSLELCDTSADDPAAPRSLDAIPGLGDLRPVIREKTLIAAASVAHKEGFSEEGEFPAGADAADVIAAWNIGFLARCCESSLPESKAHELDPVSKNLADRLAAEVGQEKPWQYWVGACLIDIGIATFREMESVTYEGDDDPDEPVFSQMDKLVMDPFATDKATRFLAAAYPALAVRMCGLGDEQWEGRGLEEWRNLDRSLHQELFDVLARAWALPPEQVAFLQGPAVKSFESDDDVERHHFAYPRYINLVAQQAYLLLLGESSDELPPWDELVRPANQVFEIFDSSLRGYLRKLQYYTQEVDYKSPS